MYWSSNIDFRFRRYWHNHHFISSTAWTVILSISRLRRRNVGIMLYVPSLRNINWKKKRKEEESKKPSHIIANITTEIDTNAVSGGIHEPNNVLMVYGLHDGDLPGQHFLRFRRQFGFVQYFDCHSFCENYNNTSYTSFVHNNKKTYHIILFI